MIGQSQNSIESTTSEDTAALEQTKLLPVLVSCAAVFIVAFTACLCHNLFEPNTKTTYFADSRNYLASANHFSTMFLDALHGKSPAQLMSDPAIKQRIETDGPILATILGFVFTVIGHPPQAADWKVFAAIYSVIHAMTSTCIFLLVFRIVPSLRIAIPTGIAYGLFPPAAIAAGRLMTETLSNLLVVGFLLTLSLSVKRTAWSLAVGFIGGVSFVNRVLLAPSVVVCLSVFFFLRKLKLSAFIMIVVAFISVIAPWTLFSATYLGRPMLTTERAGAHNAVNGWDIEQDGLQNTYGGFKEVLIATDNPLGIIMGLISHDPQGSATLLVKKFARLYGHPFNDFRHKCFGLDIHAIQLIQWLYLFMGLFGIILFAAGGYRQFKPEPRLIVCSALVYLACMQCFLMFEAHSRHGFTAFPLLIIFGAVAAYLFADLLSRGLIPRAVALTAGAVLVTGLVVSSEKLVTAARPDSELKLAAGQIATCSFKVTEKMKSAVDNKEAALLLVDGDSGLDGAQVSVNGRKLGVTMMPLAYLDSERFKNCNLMRECAYGLAVTVGDLRQWRAAVIPTEYLKVGEENTFAVTAGVGGASIFVDPNPEKRQYRDTELISVNRLLNTPSGYEMRPWSSVLSASLHKKFSLAGDSNSGPAGIPHLRMYLAMSHRRPGSITEPPQLTEEPFSKELHQKDFPLLMRVAKTDDVMVSKFVLAHSATGASVRIPHFKNATHIRIRLTGEVKSDRDGLPVGIAITTADDKDMPWILPGLPFSIPTTKDWKAFESKDLVPLRIYNGPVSQVAIGLFPGPWPETSGVSPALGRGSFIFRNLKLVVEPVASVDLSGATLTLY